MNRPIYEVAFDMSKQNVERQQATRRSNMQLVAFDMSNVECYKLPVASTCCWCGRGFTLSRSGCRPASSF